ncbi:hypothetical protein G3N56_06100 [Desulfovibrio sulfodismutans]|uniref:Uncharacterized protein n=1 Tax=Desulfolutivibrio sulfodismutans TaxID=63561 RepID=A0A7K3NJD8_9BACT|nr:hypothetical protein [Desulfolutivibrio sulfodismutans]NDY56314.1 hypothetical protein [Desulfolutivibrio sulfodismutans]QLA11499.1 hypothetical protein GD606_04020 [Desulfolutivibrio sulfodismutans DSM 3696]QLA14201.1 hypothetical protein GD606_18975 [Desulfolutivibrio sulfodismutans DSM 3696]
MSEPHDTPSSQGDEIRCPNCGVSFRLDDLKRQLAQGKFACPVCGSGFTQPKTANRKILLAAAGLVLLIIALAIIKNTSFYVVQKPPVAPSTPVIPVPIPVAQPEKAQPKRHIDAVPPVVIPKKPLDIAIVPVAKGIWLNRFNEYKPKSPEYSFSVKNTGAVPLDRVVVICKMTSVQHNTILCDHYISVDKLKPGETSTIHRVTISGRDLFTLLGNKPIDFDIRVEVGVRSDGEFIVYRTDYYESSMFQ